ncbi:MAG: tripartite tricarboxylate transporter TctB family protein [Gammaproteobacteria bacterium]|nr:tripartite tricarboxylate transporter TctB family protein [Gammaproteobacteria bacterium]
MSRRFQENIVAGIVLIVFIAYLLATLGFGPNARLVPLPIAILGIVLVLVQLVRQNLRGAKELQIDIFSSLTGVKNTTNTEEEPSKKPQNNFQREIQAMFFIIIFIGLILLLGPVIAVFLFSSGFLAITRHYAPIKAVWTSALFSGVLYLLFVAVLQLQLYHGVLASLITS